MKFTFSILFSLLITISCPGATPSQLQIDQSAGQPELRLEREPVALLGGMRYRLRVEASSDLQAWAPFGELQSDQSAPRLPIGANAGFQFFRLRPELEDAGGNPEGAELFGFDRIFREELGKAGFLTPEEFASLHRPGTGYLDSIRFDPTQGKYWDAFNADPAAVNAALPPNTLDKRLYDFRLNSEEMAVFKKHGFVVSERLGSFSFADVFYRIFSDDLPVFISADAILHAWHFSYQRLLEESEETQLAPALQAILDGMRTKLGELQPSIRDGPLQQSLQDADYFITVARSLLSGEPAVPVFGDTNRVQKTLDAVARLEFILDPPGFDLWGTNRTVDFSQFKVRGHYERTTALGRYFQSFMWTARTDLQILGFDKDRKPTPQSTREFGTALVLAHLLQSSGQAEKWRQLDDVIRLFVGRTDAMTFAQLQPLLAAAGVTSLDVIKNKEQLAQFQTAFLSGDLGLQLVPSDAYYSPFGPGQTQLPRSFVFTGQRFTADGWALAQVTFDRIHWNQEIPGKTFFRKVLRRYPSALDVAYSILGNRQIGCEMGQRMLATDGLAFRDGLPYAHNLTALAATMDRIAPAAWEDSIYSRWLAALRTLSAPTTNAHFPQSMRTRAWAMRTLNTQLASYTELKHDTVLYAKQPYTATILCEYPAGFIEPVPEFWRRMKEMAEATARGLETLSASGFMEMRGEFDMRISVDLALRHRARINHCTQFAQRMATLQKMAEKELLAEPFSNEEVSFIRATMNREDNSYSGPAFDGWYPGLFYKDYGQLLGGVDSNGSNKQDALVTDIHTAPPDQVDSTGGILHNATGNVDFLLICVDSEGDKMVYAGPTLSHYEFIEPGPALKRLTDSEWTARFPAPSGQGFGNIPPRPEWTRSYLVPKK